MSEIITSDTGAYGRRRSTTPPSKPSDEWFCEGLGFEKALLDSDGDGIPDDWESEHGLNRADPGDFSKVMLSGYTAIKEYMNDRADLLISEAIKMKH
jgi:hypothetical protein